jgi:hypothetical protein
VPESAFDVQAMLAGRASLLRDACEWGGGLPRDSGGPATASYPPGSEAEAMGLTPQSSQRARGVEVWAVLASLGREGTCWCGPTTWQGRRAMRVSVSAWSTTEEDIDRSIAAVRACALRPT